LRKTKVSLKIKKAIKEPSTFGKNTRFGKRQLLEIPLNKIAKSLEKFTTKGILQWLL